ncbi:MAG: restriction endonuclease subunit R [Bacteroidetes bacterium HGW-Bacteroidetes-12]|nr:MAG: restriction endonuclease subunit R [Bacteroidetes bacterium HGW-Bacteroidetes-12]
MVSNPENINTFHSLFRGREDVFAVRWEKGDKKGYMPSYFYDPYMYRVHKMKGGTFQNYKDKSYLPLNDNEIVKHLNGIQQIGVYPLLPDNTSLFLVADFDKNNWIAEAKTFLNACEQRNISAYLERSRSGNGGHVWIFFEQPYPAIRSRKIFISILEQSGIFSLFDKSSSFDRLFPNQDFLSDKGLGNLIALPLFKTTLEQGNSCFIDPKTLKPIIDQWHFLQNIKRVHASALDNLYQDFSTTNKPVFQKKEIGKMIISLENMVTLSRDEMTTPLINFLKEELNFANSEFIIKKKMGKKTFGTERFFKLVEETENEVIIPRGFIGKLIRFCRENQIEHNLLDKRKKKDCVSFSFSFNAQLRDHQKQALKIISKKDFGVIVAPPSSGKTIIGLKIIAEKQQPALIIVHRKQLVEQWIERIETFLGIPKSEIGKIGQGKNKIGNRITVATIQSLPKQIENIETAFGTIIIDECHHIPAETFRNTIEKLHTFYLYGLTATPFRKFSDGKLIFTHIGEIIATIKPNEIESFKQAKIVIHNTELDVPYNSKTDSFETLSKILIHDSTRNKLILKDVKRELNAGKKVVIITERKEHIDSLNQFLKQSYEVVTLSGEDSENNRKSKWQILNEGNFQALITTGQYFGEGTDLQSINCLFLVYPFSFEGKLIQYIGRVQRSEISPIIYDYRDYRINYLNKLFLKRNTYYRKINKQATLFDEPTEDKPVSSDIKTIEKTIKIQIEELEFGYGVVSFNYLIGEMNTALEFEIENLEVRPEFDVLKPYFSKTLKSKNISVDIFAEFEYGKLVSQLANSLDIEKINQEVVESVKFQFITKNVLGKLATTKENLLTINELENQNLYIDGAILLEDILKTKNFKHSQNIRYLADKHQSNLMKIRFVLSPFSFVFLLSGEQQYHIVLETLDTEEATYLWHTDKSKQKLIDKVKEIDSQLNIIRNKGRQVFLETNPNNFSKIIHDYSDNKKGFIIWKDMLEERIT